MIKRGLDRKDIESCILNLPTQINGKQTDLFTLTENKNSPDAISDYLEYFIREKT
jgi:hypothetical protein